MPSTVRLWQPTQAELVSFAQPDGLVWAPHTTPLTGGTWVDGRWVGRSGEEVFEFDVAVDDDDGCGDCLTPVEVAYARLHYAETGRYLIVRVGDAPPVLVLPGEKITLEHALAGLRYCAVTLMGRNSTTVDVRVPLYERADAYRG